MIGSYYSGDNIVDSLISQNNEWYSMLKAVWVQVNLLYKTIQHPQ